MRLSWLCTCGCELGLNSGVLCVCACVCVSVFARYVWLVTFQGLTPRGDLDLVVPDANQVKGYNPRMWTVEVVKGVSDLVPTDYTFEVRSVVGCLVCSYVTHHVFVCVCVWGGGLCVCVCDGARATCATFCARRCKP